MKDIPDTAGEGSRRPMIPRAPTRGRGVIRYAALVEATEQLLLEHSSDDIGLYQIAERAGVPPASVYHFFPTKEAAFLALTQQYLEAFGDIGRRPIPADALQSWQALFAWDQRQAVDYYNANGPAAKLLLGGFGGEEIRQTNRQWNEAAARGMLDRLQQLFIWPSSPNEERMLYVQIELLDTIWRISYLRHGLITDDYYREALDASLAYCRLYLPHFIALCPKTLERVSNGEPVMVSFAERGGFERTAAIGLFRPVERERGRR